MGAKQNALFTHQDVLERLLVLLVLKVLVRALSVPGVERMVADHVERALREGRLLLHDHVLGKGKGV